jgi:Protein of unknown function (DUF3179)
MQNRSRWQSYKPLLRSGTRWLTSLLALGILAPPMTLAEVRIDPSEIVTLLPKDAIPAIRDPKPLLVPADEVKGVRDSDQVLGVNMDGESRAYPISFLSWHEIVNDTVGAVAIAATW